VDCLGCGERVRWADFLILLADRKEGHMGEEAASISGPDLTQGISVAAVTAGTPLLGHVGGQAVLLVRLGADVLAVGATCTHYSGPLAEGIVVGDTIRCPWHHASFNLRTGVALRPPALNALPCWRVEQRDGMAFVREPLPAAPRPALAPTGLPQSVVIIGGGAAGNAAAETLREEGYPGPVTLLSADEAPPCDRPNLSKDYLAGSATEDWIPLRPLSFYATERIDLRLGTRVAAIEPAARALHLADGSRLPYGALLLATGAEPIPLAVPGAGMPHVHMLRTLRDGRALITAAAGARRAVVIGASFIGLEVAASLRARNIDVHVVAPEDRPMARIMGPAIGDMVRAIHERHGVTFHLGVTATAIDEAEVTLSNGERLAADLVVVGIGVRPATGLAERAGLATDRGVKVDEYLQTSVPGIFAAGDIARWPDQRTGAPIRVEHWVVAECQGQVAARNMLGRKQRFDAVPFFWSQHYDTTIAYVGHAEHWDQIAIDGDPSQQDCTATFWHEGKRRAVVTVGRDRDSLRAELAFEQEESA
jgi:NADPH-dependent 2,4-dienoyl-CoA reductase/sulfur reductase-like enzyme/nitrite reductase/ring-hydroxylating ferredoxin subunit